MPSSRLVVVSITLPPSALISTLFRTAICGLELTTFVTCLRPVEKCSLLILNFIMVFLFCPAAVDAAPCHGILTGIYWIN